MNEIMYLVLSRSQLNNLLRVANISSFRNRYYEVPHSVSSVFTGREGICQQLSESCLPSRAQDIFKQQRRFVLHGMGGSGKTQVCVKFAQDHRERCAHGCFEHYQDDIR